MNTNLIRTFFERNQGGQDYQIIEGNYEFGAWLRSLGANEEIASHFERFSINKNAEIKHGRFFAPTSIREYHKNYPQIAAAGFLAIGTDPGGNFIVLDLRSSAVGYISHELIAEGCSRDDFEFCDSSLESFLEKVEQLPFS